VAARERGALEPRPDVQAEPALERHHAPSVAERRTPAAIPCDQLPDEEIDGVATQADGDLVASGERAPQRRRPEPAQVAVCRRVYLPHGTGSSAVA
jgi:hypothetical protein